MVKRKKVIVALLLLSIIISFPIKSDAYEIKNGYVLIWNNSYGSYDYYFKCNGDALTPGTYAAEKYSETYGKWNGISSNAYAVNTTYEESNVKFATVEVETYWEILCGGVDNALVSYGTTVLYDITGYEINDRTNPQQETSYIRSADIYMNPYNSFDALLPANQRKRALKTLVHELGHAMCIGHPPASVQSSTNAIMNSGFGTKALFEEPQSADITQYRIKYGN